MNHIIPLRPDFTLLKSWSLLDLTTKIPGCLPRPVHLVGLELELPFPQYYAAAKTSVQLFR